VKLQTIIPAIAMLAILSGCGNSARSTSPVSNLDTTPPPAVTGLTVLTIGSTGAGTLIWEPSAAADLAGYQVYSSDNNQYQLMGTTTDTHYGIPSAAAGATFGVRAIDDAGNASPYSVVTVGDNGQ